MKVKFKYDIADIHLCKTKEIQSSATAEDIIAMYPIVMDGLDYHLFSSYEIVKEGD